MGKGLVRTEFWRIRIPKTEPEAKFMLDDEQRTESTAPVDGKHARSNAQPNVIDPDICHTVMESLPDGIILMDSTRQIVAANIATEGIFGYLREELMSQSADRLVPAAYQRRYLKVCAEFFDDPNRHSIVGRDLYALRKDGSETAVSIKLGPIQSGDQIFACAVIRDVSNRRRVETALRDAEAHVKLLLDSTDEAIYGLDVHGDTTFCNRACVEILGYENPGDLLGKNMHNLIHHTRRDGSEYPVNECKIYQAFRVGKGAHVDDEVLWRANGSSFPAEYRSLPIHRDGKLVGSVVTFFDITERKRVEEELRQKQSELNHVARLSMLGEMAAGLAHELNQPLTAVSALAEGALLRLERGKLSESEFITVCGKIATDAQRAGDIIHRLRKFVQKRKTEPCQVCVNKLVRDVVQFIETEVKQENLTVQWRMQDGLWDVEADPIEIQQVIVNLIRNASDAMTNDDSPRREIAIETRNKGSWGVEIVVSDSGPGISANLADRVFEPFYTSKNDGLGIGLGICKSIVEAHGGRIWIGQSFMGGASIHFDLPAQMHQGDMYEI